MGYPTVENVVMDPRIVTDVSEVEEACMWRDFGHTSALNCGTVGRDLSAM